jgi:cytochrome c oxidase cbb3-type subunit 3
MSTNDETKKNTGQESGYEIDTLTNDRLIADHEYDGIQELDNDLPPWWKWLFYITIAFAIIYLVRLWVFDADDLYQEREFQQEMADAASTMPVQPAAEDFKIELLTDPAGIARGKEHYDKICQVCHLLDGGGLVGPNFTDNYWIHGNTIEEWFSVVTNGVLEKGMIAYKDQLSPTQRLEVLSYIATLHGTTPANPKAPEGQEMEWLY